MDKLLQELEKLGGDPVNVLPETFVNDEKLYIECLLKFPHDSNMQELRDALQHDDTAVAIRAAHTLKGVADNLGLLPIVDAAYSVMADLRHGETAQVKADMDELEAVYAQFAVLLEA